MTKPSSPISKAKQGVAQSVATPQPSPVKSPETQVTSDGGEELETLLVLVDRRDRDRYWLGHKVNLIELFTVFVLAVSVLVSLYSASLTSETSRQSIHFQTELSANETWTSYRNMEIEFERDFGHNYQYPNNDPIGSRRYELLNERLLMAADLLTYMNEVTPG